MVKDRVIVLRDIDAALPILAQEQRLALDIETSGFSPYKDKIAVVSLYGAENRVAGIFHIRGSLPEKLRSFLSSGKNFILHNGVGFDLLFLAQNGVEWGNNTYYDTLIGEQVATASGRANISKSLKESLKRRLKKEIDKEHGDSTWMIEELSEEQVQYCVEDVQDLHRLRDAQIKECAKDSRIQALNIELLLLPTVVKMELHGLPLSLEKLVEYTQQEHERALAAEEFLFKEVFKKPINMNSPLQLKKALNDAGFKVEDTMKSTLASLATLATDEYAKKVFEAVITGRQGNKRSSMYDDEWLEKYVICEDDTYWVKARFNQCSTDTTRFSSSDPNLQQIPKNMRGVFKSPVGYKMVWADYSQLEAWIAAGLAGDKKYIEALLTGDVHTAVASLIYKVPPSSITKDDKRRKNGKFCNFLLLFGGGAERLRSYALAAGSNMTEEESEKIVEDFLKSFPQLAEERATAINIAHNRKFFEIVLPTGIKRSLGGELKPTQILNTRVQGTAACGLKYSLLELQERGLDKYLAATVHDELVLVVPDNLAEEVAQELKECMETGMKQAIDLPITAEVNIGEVWG